MSADETEIAAAMGEEPDEDAEPESPDDPDEDAEPDADQPAPPAAAPRSQSEIEAIQDKLQREADRHANRVAEIMGEDFAMLVPSPVDWTPGYLFNAPGMLPQPEQMAELDALVGRGHPAEMLEATDAQPCATCAALGRVLTGSRVAGQEDKPCSTCNGSGWTFKAAPLTAVPDYSVNVTPPQTAQLPPNAVQLPDPWGRPHGHPQYGLHPATVGV